MERESSHDGAWQMRTTPTYITDVDIAKVWAMNGIGLSLLAQRFGAKAHALERPSENRRGSA